MKISEQLMMEACSEYDKEATANKPAKHAQQVDIHQHTTWYLIKAPPGFVAGRRCALPQPGWQDFGMHVGCSFLGLFVNCRLTHVVALSRARVTARARASEKEKALLSQDLAARVHIPSHGPMRPIAL